MYKACHERWDPPNHFHKRVTLWYQSLVSIRAKVFMCGREQAIRLPKDFRVSGAEVLLKRLPEGILITEQDPWDVCEEACRELSTSFFRVMKHRNDRSRGQRRRLSA